MTVIRLLGNESQAAKKEERIISARDADNKNLQEKLQKLEFCRSILKQEDNSLRELGEQQSDFKTVIKICTTRYPIAYENSHPSSLPARMVCHQDITMNPPG